MPAQIFVVTDNRSLSLALTGLDYDVVDLRPTEIEWWLAGNAESPALVVVGAEQPNDALDIVVAATDRHPTTPYLIVSSTAAGWDGVSFPGRHVEVLPLPVTRTSLVAAVKRLVSAAAPAPAQPSPAKPTPAQPTSVKPTPARHMVAARSTDALRERLARRAELDDGLRVAAP